TSRFCGVASKAQRVAATPNPLSLGTPPDRSSIRYRKRRNHLAAQLGPNARAALEWIDRFGDRDGDGYVEYQRRNSDNGLENQLFADGTRAATPQLRSSGADDLHRALAQQSAARRH